MLAHTEEQSLSLVYCAAPIAADDVALVFIDEQVLLKGDELPRWKEIAGLVSAEAMRHAFTLDGTRYYVAWPAQEPEAQAPLACQSVRIFRHLAEQRTAYVLNLAYHLASWYRQHEFCGACGARIAPAPVERALCCPQCGLTIYPTISPAVTVAIEDGERILLVRNCYGKFRHFSLVAGYVEAGETFEQTVHREVHEEVGLRVKNLRYYASQPWGLSQTEMVGYFVELDGSDAITLQESELAEAKWFRRDELEPMNTTSLSFEMIEKFRRGEA